MRGVGKVYSTSGLAVEALSGVDLDITAGEYWAITGASGSGKSTLMHIMGCLDSPTSGRYRLAGADVDTLSESDLARIRNSAVGFVFQQFNLLPTMTAAGNVELPLVYAGVPRARRRALALSALDRVGLSGRVDHRPGELSGGQQQRVSIARALVTDPAIILADEPTGNLDSSATADVLDLFEALHADGRTLVVITHDDEVAARAQRQAVMTDGRLAVDALASSAQGRAT
ncbi:MAG: ABC transporter ATP-binding protein [Dermatophilus congolensis]|nr:ABC transporter ATP-binding protein [Dermatophilus congolensis]